MQRITLFCVGKMKERFYIDAASEYEKRLSRYCSLRLVEIPEERLPEAPSPAQIDAALKKEAAAIQDRLPAKAVLAALCIEGKLLSSEDFAAFLSRSAQNTGELVFLIGGSFGLHPALKSRAAFPLSMSPMTFPHHLARVMLLEQLYRGFQINAGGRYHK